VGVKVTAEPDVPVSLRDGLGKVLRRRLAPLNLASAHMTLTESHDGLPMVLIETYFAGGPFVTPPVSPEAVRARLDTDSELLGAAQAHWPGLMTHLRVRPSVPAPSSPRRRAA
jgi:hypothetical protein